MRGTSRTVTRRPGGGRRCGGKPAETGNKATPGAAAVAKATPRRMRPRPPRPPGSLHLPAWPGSQHGRPQRGASGLRLPACRGLPRALLGTIAGSWRRHVSGPRGSSPCRSSLPAAPVPPAGRCSSLRPAPLASSLGAGTPRRRWPSARPVAERGLSQHLDPQHPPGVLRWPHPEKRAGGEDRGAELGLAPHRGTLNVGWCYFITSFGAGRTSRSPRPKREAKGMKCLESQVSRGSRSSSTLQVVLLDSTEGNKCSPVSQEERCCLSSCVNKLLRKRAVAYWGGHRRKAASWLFLFSFRIPKQGRQMFQR